MHYMYVLRKEKEYYVGSTPDLRRRVAEHARLRPGYKLVYYEAYLTLTLARQRERKFKQYGSAWRSVKKRLEA